MKRLKVSKVAKEKSSLALKKQFMLSAIDVIAAKVVEMKKNNGGRMPYGELSKMLKEGKKIYPSLSRRTVNNHIKKLEHEELPLRTRLLTIVKGKEESKNTDVSSISKLTVSSKSHTSTSFQSECSISKYNAASSESSIDRCDVASSAPSITEANVLAPAVTLGGRPKGTTLAYSADLSSNIEEATKEAVKELAKMSLKAHASGRLERGALTVIIHEAKQKYKVPDDVVILPATIRQRLKRGSNSGHSGQISPMADIEPYIVSIIIQLANMRVPISSAQGLALCNSIIEGTRFQKQVVDYKNKNCRTSSNKLGPAYWRGFLKRNKHLIRAKKPVRFENKRAEWCTYVNMEEMYSEVYSQLVESGLAVKHNEAVFRDENGCVVEDEESAVGLKSPYELIHPEWLIFVDEVGSNTAQTKDGQVGGQLFLCGKDARPQQRAAVKDSHFTVLGFTAASGEPLMCSIIFSSKHMKDEWRLGFNPFVTWAGEEDDLEQNTGGEDKVFPLGPQCTFMGKKVPCYTCCSENGSITGQLLTDMLSAIDKAKVFDRSVGLNPFLFLDGHNSRFELEFLQYIHNPETKWEVCIGLPYGTSYWQVGDSTEQNGCFKMALYKAKQELVQKKCDHSLPFAVEKEDIVGLVRTAWSKSFARVKENRKATLMRGWGPKALNFNVLVHPEIRCSNAATDTMQLKLNSTVQPEDLNLSDGLTGTLVDRIVHHKTIVDSRTGEDAMERMRKRKATAEEQIRNKEKRMTSGLLASAGHFHLSSQVRDYVLSKENAEKEKTRQAQKKKRDEWEALNAQVQIIRDRNKPPEQWTSEQLKTMLKWYKRPKDEKLPTKKQEMLARYRSTCNRGDLPAPPLTADIDQGYNPPLPRDTDQGDAALHGNLPPPAVPSEEARDEIGSIVPC